jgi:hypothetical protein
MPCRKLLFKAASSLRQDHEMRTQSLPDRAGQGYFTGMRNSAHQVPIIPDTPALFLCSCQRGGSTGHSESLQNE